MARSTTTGVPSADSQPRTDPAIHDTAGPYPTCFSNGRTAARHAEPSASPVAQTRDISSREVDPVPLTEAEVFNGPGVPGAAGDPPYSVLKTQLSADCTVAATDQLGALLNQLGCDQV